MSSARAPRPGLNTVSLRVRLTIMTIVVLGIVLLAVGIVVDTVYARQSEQNLDTLLTGRVQLARQLARSGVGPQLLVNRVEADGVRAYLVLRNGNAYGTAVPAGDQIKITQATLAANGRLAGAQLTLAVDTALVDGAHRTLRRILIVTGLVALAVSALLIAAAVRLALRPLNTMAEVARTIADGRRGSRLSPTRTDTELGQTAAAFDDMLDELEGAETRARQAEAQTRAFLDDAAHELRTPISGVQAAAETLLQQGDRLDQADRERLQVLLIREAQRAGTLVSDLLAAARLDAGVELDLAPVSLSMIMAAEVERARLIHPEVAMEIFGPAVVVPGDVAQLGGIIRNLLDNAVRAAGPRGTVRVIMSEHPGWAVVEVTDSGPGVRAADRERIFDRLVRLDRDRSAEGGGSGLGLAIARGYARAHGGTLTCEEPHGPGARFRLILPTGR